METLVVVLILAIVAWVIFATIKNDFNSVKKKPDQGGMVDGPGGGEDAGEGSGN